MRDVDEVISAYRNKEFLSREDYFVRVKLNDLYDMEKILGENWSKTYNIATRNKVDWLVRFLGYREYDIILEETLVSFDIYRKLDTDKNMMILKRDMKNCPKDKESAKKYLDNIAVDFGRRLSYSYGVRLVVVNGAK